MYFSFLCSLLFSLSAQALAPSDISLLASKTYNPNKEQGRGFEEFTSGLGMFFFGGLFKPSSAELKKGFLKELNRPELDSYFSSKQKDALAGRVAKEVSTNILSKGLSNTVAVEATAYSVNELVGAIIDRILEKEGIPDPKHRKIWATKIMLPFRTCAARAKTQKEAEKCQAVLQADLVKNIGIGITYETTRQELGEKYTGNTKKYIACVKAKKGTDSVKPCVLQAMQSAIYEYGRDTLLAIAKQQVPKSAAKIVEQLSPEFQKCLSKTKERAEILQCADRLTAQGGGVLAEAAVLNDPRIAENISSKAQIKVMAENAKAEFQTCVNENSKAKLRDKKGSLLTANCEMRVKNQVTQLTIKGLFEINIRRTMNNSKAEQDALITKTNKFFGQCWSNEGKEESNNKCLRDSIIFLADGVAAARIKTDLPKGSPESFKAELLSSLKGCLNKSLPIDILSKSKEAAGEIDQCSQALIKTASLSVAESEIRQALRERVKDDQVTQKIVDQTVKKDFAQCLGKAPDSLKIDICSIQLRRAVGTIIAKELFPNEFDKFVNEKGGLVAFGMKENDRDALLTNLLAEHESCLKEKIRVDSIATSTQDLNACFRSSIRTFALFLGEKEFQRSLKSSIELPAERVKAFAKTFIQEFDQCLEENKDSEITGLLSQIDLCKVTLTKKFTIKIANELLAENLNKYVPGEDQASAQKKAKIQSQIVANLEACVAEAKEASRREECNENFREQATASVVLLASQAEVKALLHTETPPKEIADLEENFAACLFNNSPSACSRSYILKLAKAVGSLKLRHSLADALGRGLYADSETAISNFERTYYDCLDSIKIVKVEDPLIQAVKQCGEKLQDQTVAFLQDQSKRWMSENQTTEKAARLAEITALALPCFDSLMPETPFREDALQNINPEGTLAAVSQMIGDYIKYDTEKAGKNVDQVIQQLFLDLQSAGAPEARARLLKTLVESGILDQLLKSMIQREVLATFAKLSGDDKISQELQLQLSSKENLDKILSPAIRN